MDYCRYHTENSPEHPPDLGSLPVETTVYGVAECLLFAELHLDVERVDLDDSFGLLLFCRLIFFVVLFCPLGVRCGA